MRLLLASLLVSATLATAAPALAAPFAVTNNGFSAYRIDLVNNPTLNLVRGQTYTFNVTAPGHPFWIKTAQVTGVGSAYNAGVTNNGLSNGTLTWTVAGNAPALLYYNCQNHSDMTGEINISDPVPGSTPTSAAILLLLLAGIGIVVARRRAAANRIA